MARRNRVAHAPPNAGGDGWKAASPLDGRAWQQSSESGTGPIFHKQRDRLAGFQPKRNEAIGDLIGQRIELLETELHTFIGD